jgi:hypothetical protein
MKNTYTFMLVGLFLISSNLFLLGENSRAKAARLPMGEMFVAVLEKVDTGCFADGECFVVAGGNHVTALLGWTNETVGKVLGVSGFGDLENHVGKKVEVYAKKVSDGKYTLYGDEAYYIKAVSN